MLKIKNKRNYFIILFYLLIIPLFGQTESSIDIKNIKNTSDSLYGLKLYAKADSLLYSAEVIYRSNEDWENWYITISLLRAHYQKEGDFIKIKSLFNEYEHFLPDNEHFIMAKLKFKKAYNYSRLIEYNKSIKEYKSAFKHFYSIDIKERIHNVYIYNIYHNLANNYAWMGDLVSALTYCEKAIYFCLNNNMIKEICDLRINKAQFFFYNQQYNESINEYKEALKLCPKTDLAFINVALAEVYLDLNKTKYAQNYLKVALKLDSSTNYYYSKIRAKFFFESGNFEKGKIEKLKAIDIVNSENNKRALIKELVNFSSYLLEGSEEKEAILYAHKALCLFFPEMDAADIFARPKNDELLPYTYIIEALYIKAKYFRDKYIETNDEFSLGEATFYYDLLLSYFDKLKSEYYSSSSQYRMGAYSQKIYSEIISFYVDQYNKNGNKGNLKNAFSLAQRANSFVLKNAVSVRKALELAGVQQDSLEQYLQLASKVATGDIEDSTRVTSDLIEFDDYKESLLSNYPSFGKYNKEEEITIEKLQTSLKPNSLVLKYYYFNEILTVIGISKDIMFAENIPFTKNLDTIINSNMEVLSQNWTTDSLANVYLSNSKKIYDLVLGDLLSNYNLESIDHLIIIPDGPLKNVSFNALALNDSGNWNNPDNYLISKYAINYLYYCSQIDDEIDTYNSKDGFIGFGIEYEDEFLNEILNDYFKDFEENVSNSRSISLSPLKYADDEVLTSAEILNGTSFTNSDVTPKKVFSSINNYDVIHFSAHAFVNEDDYLNSFVVLNKDTSENYQLKYADILNLDIDSELVVLSACQTSSGKNVMGEGLMSLSRAFVQSGSKSTVGAYWNAPDYATKELMTLFYSNLNEGMTKSKAMQQAQLEYLTNDKISSPTIRSPFYWASWALYGNDQPLSMNNTSIFDFKSWTSYLLLAGIILLIGILTLFIRSKRSV